MPNVEKKLTLKSITNLMDLYEIEQFCENKINFSLNL
jgi:hypothetical protein